MGSRNQLSCRCEKYVLAVMKILAKKIQKPIPMTVDTVAIVGV
jgi:hypothetical protein